MLILGIESSCDETAIAIVRDGQEVLSNQVSSQVKLHARYGGIVPEIASRKHVETIHLLLEDSLKEAQISPQAIDAIAVTNGPGLQGGLLVGITTAQTLAWLWDKPLIDINHLEGHIHACFLAHPEIDFPLLVLLVSGGHTELIMMTDHGQYKVLARTRDDAIGEAFDKVARLLDLPYPGGPQIDKLAKLGNPQAFNLPIAMKNKPDFSFSGLKTAMLYTIRDLQESNQPLPVEDLCASFQEVAIESVVFKAINYARKNKIQQIAVSGGVSANSLLRSKMMQRSEKHGIKCFIPPLNLCTDNAAMIAASAYFKWQKMPRDSFDNLKVYPRYPLDR